MTESITRVKMTLEDIFGMATPSKDEVEIERTPDWGAPRSPNWTDKTKVFQLGCHNAENTILSNMIAKKTKSDSLSLYDLLDFTKSQQRTFIEFIMNIVERILDKLFNNEVKTK